MCVHSENENTISIGLIVKGENCKALEGLPVPESQQHFCHKVRQQER